MCRVTVTHFGTINNTNQTAICLDLTKRYGSAEPGSTTKSFGWETVCLQCMQIPVKSTGLQFTASSPLTDQSLGSLALCL
jgi:hypothetical protein